MKSLNDLTATSLEWHQSLTNPPDFELQTKDGVVATLTFLDEEHTLARVKTAEGKWTLKHLGLMNPVVTLREEGGKNSLATFHPHALRHGKLEFVDGAVFDWVWLHESTPAAAFMGPHGLPMVQMRAHKGRDLKASPGVEWCEVSLSDHARWRQALLASFGLYLLILEDLKTQDEKAAELSLRM
jgi:hypothetical protein